MSDDYDQDAVDGWGQDWEPDSSSAVDVATEQTRLAEVEARVEKATAAAKRSHERCRAARASLDDAEGEVRIAQARQEDVAEDTDARRWQQLEATEQLAKRTRARDRARDQLRELQAEADHANQFLEQAQEDLDELHGSARAAAPAAGSDGGDDEPEPYYANLDEFVREQIIDVFRREVSQHSRFYWDAEWWRHREAVRRLDALWRAWEHLRLDPGTGASAWLRDHADHHLTVLFSKEGPFGRSQDTSTPDQPLPYSPPPAHLYAPADTAAGTADMTPVDRPENTEQEDHDG